MDKHEPFNQKVLEIEKKKQQKKSEMQVHEKYMQSEFPVKRLYCGCVSIYVAFLLFLCLLLLVLLLLL